MSAVLFFQIFLPLAINLVSALIIIYFCERRRWQVVVLLVAFLLLGGALWYAHERNAELVIVPDIMHESKDAADVFCRKLGLRFTAVPGKWADPPNRVQWQSLTPGSLVKQGSLMTVVVYRGQPVPDELFGFASDSNRNIMRK